MNVELEELIAYLEARLQATMSAEGNQQEVSLPRATLEAVVARLDAVLDAERESKFAPDW